jgi:hypothetical protein
MKFESGAHSICCPRRKRRETRGETRTCIMEAPTWVSLDLPLWRRCKNASSPAAIPGSWRESKRLIPLRIYDEPKGLQDLPASSRGAARPDGSRIPPQHIAHLWTK